jgi:hypothetical protein
MNAPAQKIDVLDNIKLAIGALSAHGEHERVDQLLETYEAISDLINVQRRLVAWNRNVNGEGRELGEICLDAASTLARIGGLP